MNLDEYIAALKRHDWTFEYSDDHRVWQEGTKNLKSLREAQRALDPLGTVWNQHAPRDCRISPK